MCINSIQDVIAAKESGTAIRDATVYRYIVYRIVLSLYRIILSLYRCIDTE